MEPIALRDADGVTYAYACGRCHNVCSHGRQMRNHGPEEVTRAAEFSLRDAEHCCQCRRCGGYADVETRYESERSYDECPACWESVGRAEREAWAARSAAIVAAEAAKRETALARALDREAAVELEAYMSELSEECYCAGWLIGLEDALWGMVEAGGSHTFGTGVVTVEDITRMRRLAEKAGGWWRHDEFVPMDAWLSRDPGGATA